MRYSKEEKEEFIKKMKAKTKQFAIDTILFCDKLPKTSGCRIYLFNLFARQLQLVPIIVQHVEEDHRKNFTQKFQSQ